MVAAEKRHVPELRFPGFAGEWREQHGRDLFSSSRTKGEDGLPIYSVTLNNGMVPRDSLDRHLAADAASTDSLRAQPGDLVYNMMRMWQGAVGRAGVECMVSPAYVVLRPKKGIDSKFFDYALLRARALYDLWAYSYGLTSDRLRLYPKDFGQIPFTVPASEEQQKIAAFLGAVDNKLTALRRKRELLQEFKRGMMQKIFSRELRFKREDGSDFPDWEEKRLGEAAKVNPNSKTLPDEFTYIDLDSVNKGVLNNPRTVQKSASPSRAQRLLDKEDILFQMVRPYQRNNYYFNLTGNYVASTGYAQLRAKSSSMFLYQLLHANSFVEKVLERCTGTSYPAINSNDLAKICISLPGDVAEQQKIADFFSAIDSKIESVAKQIGQVETFKKGLLQKMFV